MKNTIIILLALVLIAACQPKASDRYATTGPEIDLIKSLIKDYHNGDWEGWMGHYSDTAKIHHNTWENVSVSPKELNETLKGLLASTSSYKFDDDPIYFEKVIDDEGKTWVNFWGNWRGTIAANSKELQIPVHLSIHIADGKIQEEYGMYNLAEYMSVMQELGILSAPGNVGIVNGMYKSFAAGDVPAVLAAFDANIIWNEAENFPYADGNPYKGPDAVVNGVFARLGSEWDYWNLVDIQLRNMANDQVLATGRYQAKYKKNGKTIDAQFAHLWTLKEGKVLSFQQYADTKGVADVVGK